MKQLTNEEKSWLRVLSVMVNNWLVDALRLQPYLHPTTVCFQLIDQLNTDIPEYHFTYVNGCAIMVEFKG